jgi:uracil-DNA glycosylase
LNEFQPICLREDPVPEQVADCKNCGLYQHGSRMVWGEGTPGAPLLVLLDNPGAREDSSGNPYVCGTRETLQKAAYEVGLPLENIYVTYILKRRPKKAYDKPVTRAICQEHLLAQLKEYKPKMILCLGNVAIQSFFKDENREAKTLRGHWEELSGYQITGSYHPLAVRRRPNLWPYFLEDWKTVKHKMDNYCKFPGSI